MTIRKTLIALSLAAPLLSAFAMDSAIEKSIPLKDGSVLHMFKTGQMAMEDKYGRPARMRIGETVTTKDGASIAVTSDEVAKLSSVIRAHYGRTKY